MWRECDGHRSASEIAERMRLAGGEPLDEASVAVALRRLERAGLVDGQASRTAGSLEGNGPGHVAGRRAALRRVAALAGLTVSPSSSPRPRPRPRRARRLQPARERGCCPQRPLLRTRSRNRCCQVARRQRSRPSRRAAGPPGAPPRAMLDCRVCRGRGERERQWRRRRRRRRRARRAVPSSISSGRGRRRRPRQRRAQKRPGGRREAEGHGAEPAAEEPPRRPDAGAQGRPTRHRRVSGDEAARDLGLRVLRQEPPPPRLRQPLEGPPHHHQGSRRQLARRLRGGRHPPRPHDRGPRPRPGGRDAGRSSRRARAASSWSSRTTAPGSSSRRCRRSSASCSTARSSTG